MTLQVRGIKVKGDAGTRLIRVSGECLDLTGAAFVGATMSRYRARDDVLRLIVDLSRVERLDPAGVARLAGIREDVEEAGKAVAYVRRGRADGLGPTHSSQRRALLALRSPALSNGDEPILDVLDDGVEVACASAVEKEIAERRIERWGLRQGAFRQSLRAIPKLIDENPDMAMAKARQTLEALLQQHFRNEGDDPGTRRLEQLIKDLQRMRRLPRKTSALCEVIRELGNVGTHPIEDGEEVTHREAGLAFNALILVIEWYERTNASDERLLEQLEADEETHP